MVRSRGVLEKNLKPPKKICKASKICEVRIFRKKINEPSKISGKNFKPPTLSEKAHNPSNFHYFLSDLSTISLQSRWPRCKHDPEWVYVLEIARKRKPKSKKDFATYLLEATAVSFLLLRQAKICSKNLLELRT